jgi:HAD superfamily hydrolase (TIGR01450 family)
MPESRSLRDLAGAYDAILLDAFGVLVTHAGAIPGAAEGVAALKAAGQRLFVVTNDASRHPERAAAWYRQLGIEIEAEEVISSGALLTGWVRQHGLEDRRVAVLGTSDSERMLQQAGATPVRPTASALDGGPGDEGFDGVALCDEAGYSLLDASELVLNAIRSRRRRGRPMPVALANPDVVYPQGHDKMGLAIGAVATMIGAALEVTDGLALTDWCDPLGKPYPPIFEEAARRAGSKKLLMVGDQLRTDIAGANGFGIDSALMTLGGVHHGEVPEGGPRPTFLCESWR